MDATFLTKKINVDGASTNLNIWDTAGQERYHALNAVYYREASGALIVYDVTDEDSFDKVKTWSLELRKYLEEDTPIIIAGNKSDVPQRTVSLQKAEQYAEENGFTHSSTSAKTGNNVEETFMQLARQIRERAEYKASQKPTKASKGKKKKSSRGVLRVEGFQQFEPGMEEPQSNIEVESRPQSQSI